MASTISGYIGKLKIGSDGTEYSLGSTAYGVCSTAADVAAKTVEMTGFTLITGATIFVKFTETNSATNPTLNVNSTGAKALLKYGSSSLNWQAGAVLCLTYDGTSWVGNSVTLQDLGLSNAMHFIGKATVAVTDGGTEDPTINGYNFTNDRKPGDIIIDKDNGREYVWTITGAWELLGQDASTIVDTQDSSGTKFVSRIQQNSNREITATLSSATIGSEIKPVWVENGVIKGVTYLLNATINSGTAQYGIAYYSTTSNITSTEQGTNGALLTGKGANAPAWKASADGAVYATSANGDLQWGTLPIAQGGTGNTSYAANRLIYSESTSKLSATEHYASSTKIAINSTSEPSYNLYVNGTGYFTNTLGAKTIEIYDTASNGPRVDFHLSDLTSTLYGRIYILRESTYGSRMYLREYVENSSGQRTNIYENYRLPTPTRGRSTSVDFNIATTKNYPIVYVDTAAATAAKVGATDKYTLANNSYLYVEIAVANTSKNALTLNINEAGAKPIYINSEISSSSNYTLPVGLYFVYYDGTNYYFRTDSYLPVGGISLWHDGAWYSNLYIDTVGTAGTYTPANGNTPASATPGTQGEMIVRVGNSINVTPTSTTALGKNNARGRIRLYGTGTKYIDLIPAQVGTNGNYTQYLPQISGYSITAATDPVNTMDNWTATNQDRYSGYYIPLTNSTGQAYLNDVFKPEVRLYAAGGSNGYSTLSLGNNIAEGAAGNAHGELKLYGPGVKYTVLRSAQVTNDSTMYLPDYNGNGYLTHVADNTIKGSETLPVYVAANGRILPCVASSVFSAMSWEDGSSSGPSLSITVAGQTRTAAIPVAAAGKSGAVSTTTQQFDGDKTFKGHIYPQADSTYDLGSSSLHWRAIYLNGAAGAANSMTYGLNIATSHIGVNTTNNMLALHATGAINLRPDNTCTNGTFDTTYGYSITKNEIYPYTTNAYTLGTSTYRWKKVYIGTANSYGSGTQPIYWNDGVPEATDYSLSATVNASGDANKIAYYSGTNAISAGSIITDGSYLRNIGGYNNTTYAFSAASAIINSWIRTVGTSGWYNETYEGGWYMTDVKWIRSHKNKPVYIDCANNNQYGLGTHQLNLGLSGTSYASIMLRGGTTMYGFAVNNNGSWYFGKRTSNSMESATNDVYILSGGAESIVPYTTDTVSLGNSSHYFKNAFIGTGGDIHIANLSFVGVQHGSSVAYGGNRGLYNLVNRYHIGNKTYGIQPSAITLEYTTNGNAASPTWTANSGVSDANKIKLFADSSYNLTVGNATYDAGSGNIATVNAGYGLRITVDLSVEKRTGYLSMFAMGVYCRSHTCKLTIERYNTANATWATIHTWEGSSSNDVMSIYLSGTTYMQGAGTSTNTAYANKLRFTYVVTTKGSGHRYAPVISFIRSYGIGNVGITNDATTKASCGAGWIALGTSAYLPMYADPAAINGYLIEVDGSFVPRHHTDNTAVTTTNVNNIGTSSRTWANMYATTFHGALDGNATTATTATTATKLSNTTKIGDTNKPVYFTAGGVPSAISYTIDKSVPSTAVFTDTATATDDILDGSNTGTAIKYAPYASKQSKLCFYTGTTAPDGTTRLNLNGYLYATKLYSGGTEVLTSHQSLKYHKTGSWNGLTYTAAAVNSADELKFTIPTGTTNTTVALGNHTHSASLATDTGTSAITLAYAGKYKLTAGGGSVIFTMPAAPTTATTATTATKIATTLVGTGTTKVYILGCTGTTADTSATVYKAYNGSMTGNTSDRGVYFIGSTGVLYGACWNDYAEFRNTQGKKVESGRCVREIGDDTLCITEKRLERGCEIVSDTFGFAIGENDECKTPIAASGRVLAYPYESREEFAKHIGWPVCSGPNGTVSIMTEEEEEKYPSRIIGTISAVPEYEEWGTSNVKVNGRIWIRIK